MNKIPYLTDKQLNKRIEKWINKRYAPEDVVIIIEKNSLEFKPKDTLATYDADYFARLSAMIDGAKWFYVSLKEGR